MTEPDYGLLRRAAAVAEGVSDGELSRMVRRGELVRLQRGAYVREPVTEAEARHRAVVLATTAGLRLHGAVSHSSAAVLALACTCTWPDSPTTT
jgi:hypothetical protein